jgi:3-hydroxypropanoate dehydrogenase
MTTDSSDETSFSEDRTEDAAFSTEYDGCDQYFPAGHLKSNFLCNLGYGDASKLYLRAPRRDFGEVCTVL